MLNRRTDRFCTHATVVIGGGDYGPARRVVLHRYRLGVIVDDPWAYAKPVRLLTGTWRFRTWRWLRIGVAAYLRWLADHPPAVRRDPRGEWVTSPAGKKALVG